MTNEQLAVYLTKQLNDLKRIRNNLIDELPMSTREEYNPIMTLKPGPHYKYPILDDLDAYINDLDAEINTMLGKYN